MLGGWTLVGAFSAGQSYLFQVSRGAPADWTLALLPNLASCWIWAGFTPLIARLARRVPVQKHAIVLAGGNPDFIVGRKEIAASREGAPGTLSWTPRLGGVGPRGDLGWSVGTFVSEADGRPPFHGEYVTVWQKERTGAWKFVQDGGSGNPPPGP